MLLHNPRFGNEADAVDHFLWRVAFDYRDGTGQIGRIPDRTVARTSAARRTQAFATMQTGAEIWVEAPKQAAVAKRVTHKHADMSTRMYRVGED
jgi:hypothetical protein